MEQENITNNWLKRHLPASLFTRALLILVMPMLIVQAIAIYVFYIQHWENVERHFSSNLSGDVAFIVHQIKNSDDKRKRELEKLALKFFQIEITKEPADNEKGHFPSETDDAEFKVFVSQLKDKIEESFLIRRSPGGNKALLYIDMQDYVLKIKFSLKRLASVNAIIFIVWMVGSAIFLSTIATLFLRNQIRPIRKLAEAADKFGKGQDDIEFRPQGASEIRQAGRSFIAMRERIKKLITTRTEMLASISHDLRTPLTRMRLALAMIPEQKYVKQLLADVQDMEKMIQEYLDFARGKSGEQSNKVSLANLLGHVIGKYSSHGKNIKLKIENDISVNIFYNAMCRCLYNIIDNAFRYGKSCEVTVINEELHVNIIIDDDGTGIEPEQRELAMQPFKRLDSSRNLDENNGAGLGLSIVQDIVLRHGGEVYLEDAVIGGLRVRIKLPK
ncbi:MAG: ATP-binding protein [Pseudomonadota bacterium]